MQWPSEKGQTYTNNGRREKCEDSIGAIGSRNTKKDKQYNGPKKEDKQ
jgi:hypothetical protein